MTSERSIAAHRTPQVEPGIQLYCADKAIVRDTAPSTIAQSGRQLWRWSRSITLAITWGFALAGCSDSLPLVGNLPKPPVPDFLKPEKTTDRPSNMIDRALSDCPKRIEAGETDCLKTALTEAHVGLPALIAVVPDCKQGNICRYDYTTIDRVGYVPATESNFVAHWRATFDLTKPVSRIEDVPVKVVSF